MTSPQVIQILPHEYYASWSGNPGMVSSGAIAGIVIGGKQIIYYITNYQIIGKQIYMITVIPSQNGHDR